MIEIPQKLWSLNQFNDIKFIQWHHKTGVFSKRAPLCNCVLVVSLFPLRKHAYLNILKILPPKKFSNKNSIIFHISAQNIYCGYSLESPRRVPTIYVLSRNKKNNVYPCKPQFYNMKVGFKGVKIMQACFRDGSFFRCLGKAYFVIMTFSG